MLIKLDLSKDFDKLNWFFMKKMHAVFWFLSPLGKMDPQLDLKYFLLHPNKWYPLKKLSIPPRELDKEIHSASFFLS